MENLTLVLEGGAFRSLYTSGVLDVLLKENIEANCVIGVSAGALTGMNYVSKQIFNNSKQTFKAVVTNCEKGTSRII